MSDQSERVFIVGIAGTFMAGVALIARQCGYCVSGCDQNVYPPMSTVLAEHEIEFNSGYDAAQLPQQPQTVIIGNALSRGNPLIEAVLERGLPYCSGPQWLAQQVLFDRTVIAVAGTHGKTTTSSILAFMLESANCNPGFLIGGKPGNFDYSARAGSGRLFVIEADEYDTAFFDKRSKFVHYRPRIAILNNLEFDHADIFENLTAIKKQFHHLIRTIPGNGVILANAEDDNISAVLELGCWSRVETFSTSAAVPADWLAEPLSADCSRFRIHFRNQPVAKVSWSLIGHHNMANAVAAIAAAHAAGVDISRCAAALSDFKNTARRLQKLFDHAQIRLFEDFAHHPTAIRLTLEALRTRYHDTRLIAVLEPRSNSMKMGIHGDTLTQALRGADRVLIYQPTQLDWDPTQLRSDTSLSVHTTTHSILTTLQSSIQTNDTIVMMSNGGFDGLPLLTTVMLETLSN